MTQAVILRNTTDSGTNNTFLRNKRLMTVTQVTLPESDTRKETEQILDYPSDMLCQCLTMLRPFVRIQKIIKVIRSLGH